MNIRVKVLRALAHPPPRATITTKPIRAPIPRSTMARLIAVIKTHIILIDILFGLRFCVEVAVFVRLGPHRARYASSSISSSSSASLFHPNIRQLLFLSSRRISIACVRSSVDKRSCSAVRDTCICWRDWGIPGGTCEYIEGVAAPCRPGVKCCGMGKCDEAANCGVPKSRTAGIRGVYGLDTDGRGSLTEPNTDGGPPGRMYRTELMEPLRPSLPRILGAALLEGKLRAGTAPVYRPD